MVDIGVSASIVRKYVSHIYHKNLQQKKNKWSKMAGTFNTISTKELESKLQELNQIKVIIATKCHLTDNLLNYNLVLGIIFNLRKKTMFW